MKKLKKNFVGVAITILIGMNLVYYSTIKNTLEVHQDEKINLIVTDVNTSINSTKKAEKYFNIFMAQHLRTISISVKEQLPPKIDQVENEELVRLANQWDLEGLSLLEKKDDDIVVTKSNLQRELGLSTKDFGEWYTMFNQLFEQKNVAPIPVFGEKLKNFWAGPVDTSETNPKLISKWGYYYDGTTDYMIAPFLKDTMIREFSKEAGVNKTIEHTLSDIPELMEISVVNSKVLDEGERPHGNTGVVWLSDRLVVYGTYNYKSSKDEEYVEKAITSKHIIKKTMVINDKKILRHYVPVSFKNGKNTKDNLVVIVSSDYQALQKELNQKMIRAALISFSCLLVGIFLIYYLIRIINKKEKTLFNVQEMYSKQIEDLFRTVKEYRHDFNHHIFTISGMMNLNMYGQLKKYVNNLMKIQTDLNDIINVNIPAFSGLLQSKIAEAGEKRIEFEHHFEHFELLNLDMMKVSNLVRIVGNILDNAFFAVKDKPEGIRKVVVVGRYQAGRISITISNNGERIPEEQLEKIFSFGFTTKRAANGSGIGLASSQKIIEEYKGSITVSSNEDWTSFTVHLPVLPKEIREEKIYYTG